MASLISRAYADEGREAIKDDGRVAEGAARLSGLSLSHISLPGVLILLRVMLSWA